MGVRDASQNLCHLKGILSFEKHHSAMQYSKLCKRERRSFIIPKNIDYHHFFAIWNSIPKLFMQWHKKKMIIFFFELYPFETTDSIKYKCTCVLITHKRIAKRRPFFIFTKFEYCKLCKLPSELSVLVKQWPGKYFFMLVVRGCVRLHSIYTRVEIHSSQLAISVFYTNHAFFSHHFTLHKIYKYNFPGGIAKGANFWVEIVSIINYNPRHVSTLLLKSQGLFSFTLKCCNEARPIFN